MIVTIHPVRIEIQPNSEFTHYSSEVVKSMIYQIMKDEHINGNINIRDDDTVLVFAPAEYMYKLLNEILWLYQHSIKEII